MRGTWLRADLASLPRQLKLKFQYAMQRRRDDNMTKTRPDDIRAVIKVLAGSGAASLLMLGEQPGPSPTAPTGSLCTAGWTPATSATSTDSPCT